MLLSTEGSLWPEGYDKIKLASVDSTMAEATRVAPTLMRPTWIMADQQTAAKGRQGRVWKNPEGNFAATLVMRPEGTAADAALRSFFAANALYETLSLYADRTKLAVKWPNDVLLAGGKIAGILLESVGQGSGVAWLSIGIGVNLASAPDVADAMFPPVCLADRGTAPDTTEFLEALAVNFATEEATYAKLGFAPIRESWLRKAARLGEVITARTPREEITGVFETIDAQGTLILKTPKGLRPVPAADVYF